MTPPIALLRPYKNTHEIIMNMQFLFVNKFFIDSVIFIQTIAFLSRSSTVGGESGSSLRKIKDGTVKVVTIKLQIKMQKSNSLYCILWFSLKNKLGNRKLIKLPRGIDILPKAVALPLSLSPNQVIAIFATGFWMKACEIDAIICPMRTKQKLLLMLTSILNHVPIIKKTPPIYMHFLNPNFERTARDMKFPGTNIIKNIRAHKLGTISGTL